MCFRVCVCVLCPRTFHVYRIMFNLKDLSIKQNISLSIVVFSSLSLFLLLCLCLSLSLYLYTCVCVCECCSFAIECSSLLACVYPSVFLLCVSLCLWVCEFMCVSVYMCVCLYVCFFICMFVYVYLVWFSFSLWYINHWRLFNSKSIFIHKQFYF